MASMDAQARIIQWFIIYLTQNPSCMAKLQEEIDQVIGLSSTPQLADRGRMPYTEACFWETVRLSTVFPVAFPRRVTQPFRLDGALVPKNAIILLNLMGQNMDPKVWQRPNAFEPERFLTPERKIDAAVRSQVLSLGMGRRMCLGYNLARDSVFLLITSVLQKFSFELVDGLDSVQGSVGIVHSLPQRLRIRAVKRHEE